MNKLDKLVQKLVDEFGGEPWHWHHLADCHLCYFYEDGGVEWCFVVTGALHKYPQTKSEWLDEAYRINDQWAFQRVMRSIYEPIIQRQLRQEVVTFNAIQKRETT